MGVHNVAAPSHGFCEGSLSPCSHLSNHLYRRPTAMRAPFQRCALTRCVFSAATLSHVLVWRADQAGEGRVPQPHGSLRGRQSSQWREAPHRGAVFRVTLCRGALCRGCPAVGCQHRVRCRGSPCRRACRASWIARPKGSAPWHAAPRGTASWVAGAPRCEWPRCGTRGFCSRAARVRVVARSRRAPWP